MDKTTFFEKDDAIIVTKPFVGVDDAMK